MDMPIPQVEFTELMRKFEDKAYRDAYVTAEQRQIIAYQIRAMRKDRSWSQSQLGEHAGNIRQERISVYENPEEQIPRIPTLNKLASAFDVALVVRFVTFDELARWSSNLSNETLVVPGFKHREGGAPVGRFWQNISTSASSKSDQMDSTGKIVDLTRYRVSNTHDRTSNFQIESISAVAAGGN